MIPKTLAHILHPIVKLLARTAVEHKFVYLNDRPMLDSNAIFAFNHSCKCDIPYTWYITKCHSWLVVGAQPLKWIDRLVFEMNGSIWVDRKDRESRALCRQKMLDTIGGAIIIFPEGTWNTVPSLPMMPMAWGIVDTAMKSGAPIVPIVVDYFGKNCYIKYGKPFY